MPDGPEQEARDQIFLSQLGKEQLEGHFPSRWTCPEVQPWLYGYDAYKVVGQAIEDDPFEEDIVVKRSDRVMVGNGMKTAQRKSRTWLLSRLRGWFRL